MPKASDDNRLSSSVPSENSLVIWLLQSSVIVAFVTAVLYAFGANYDYRLRWELGLENVRIDRATSDVAYDGLIVVMSWFEHAQPYLILLISATFAGLTLRVPVRGFSLSARRWTLIGTLVSVIVISATSINLHLRDRAAMIANIQKTTAAKREHSLTLNDKSRIEGFVVSSVNERTVLIDETGNTHIIPSAEIKSLDMRGR